jgi:hypothetical protein
MSSLTTTQIQDAIRRKILEESTDIVTDATILLNINFTYDDLKFRTFTNDQLDQATITLANGVGTLPATFGTAYGVGFASTTDKTPYNERSLPDFDRSVDEYAFTIDKRNNQILVTPTSTPELILRFWPTYAALTTSQNPELNEYLHELLIYGAMARIHEDLQNEQLSDYYEQKYEEKLAKKISALSNYDEENMGGNEFFSYQKLI